MKNPIKLEKILPKDALKLLSSSTVIVILALVFIFMGYTELRDWQKKRQVDAEIKELTKQAAELEDKNKQINDSLTFLNSSNFKEKIAREQLNLKKEGELVFDTTTPPAGQDQASNLQPKNNSNIIKWYSYFFEK